MTRFARLVLGTGLVLLAFAGAAAEQAVTLEGEFVWVREDGESTGDLKAVFTPAGENQWTVDFHFDWEDGPHTYSGTATGNLASGELAGSVQNDNEERKANFTFTGAFEDGTFRGTHQHVPAEGDPRPTGTMTLAAAAE